MLRALKVRLDEILGNTLEQIILFGSRSRKDAKEDSDYDILVLVEKRTPGIEDQVDALAYEMLNQFGAVVTIFVEEMRTYESALHEPLFCNIRQEGAVL
jgi:predicted nucleotidyltransferase